jgi:hypothetical protein
MPRVRATSTGIDRCHREPDYHCSPWSPETHAELDDHHAFGDAASEAVAHSGDWYSQNGWTQLRCDGGAE